MSSIAYNFVKRITLFRLLTAFPVVIFKNITLRFLINSNIVMVDDDDDELIAILDPSASGLLCTLMSIALKSTSGTKASKRFSVR